MRLGLWPDDVSPEARVLFWSRGLRAFGDGFVSLLLPVYLPILLTFLIWMSRCR